MEERVQEKIEIGERLKARRQELKYTLRDLAERTGFTASYLSQIERDQVDPSIKSLHRIAGALNVPILYFLEKKVDSNPVVRGGERKHLSLPSSRVTYELLTPDLDRKMEMFMCRVAPDVENIAHSLGTPTEECILVLEGTLHVKLSGGEYKLEEGDSIYFEGTQLVQIYAEGEREAVFVSALTPAVF